jgi:serine/threonine protein kinase
LGSPGYQSPEQKECNRRWIGPRTDLYGVGATAWSLFTGFRLDLNLQLLASQTSGERFALPPLSKYRLCCPSLEQVVMSMLTVDPANRPGGAAEVLATLHALSLRSSGLLQLAETKEWDIRRTGDPQVGRIVRGLVDPLWVSICSSPRPVLKYVRFRKGESLCIQGEDAFRTFVLLTGFVVVEKNGTAIATESREGTFLGENASLTGRPRTATIRAASDDVWALLFNAAELEQFVMEHPAVGIRLIKTLAMRNRHLDNL